MNGVSGLFKAVEANIHALRREQHVGYPDGHERCLLVADDLEDALRCYGCCGWCGAYLPDVPYRRHGVSYCDAGCANEDGRADAAAELGAAS